METVIDGKTGVFFEEQTVDSLCDAMLRLEELSFSAEEIRSNALGFSKEQFDNSFQNAVQAAIQRQGGLVQ